MNLERLYFRTRKEIRIWFETNHNKSSGFWLVCYKKHTKKVCISYNTAVEEALCFGWIDSIVKSVDEETYLRKFTPRSNTKNWSDTNKIRVLKLIKTGRMTDIGLRKIDVYINTGNIDWDENKIKLKKAKILEVPEYVLSKLVSHQLALSNFKKLSEAQQRKYIDWITSAKKQETIDRRIKESIQLLVENKKLGMK